MLSGGDDDSFRRPIPVIGEVGDGAKVGKAALTNFESLKSAQPRR